MVRKSPGGGRPAKVPASAESLSQADARRIALAAQEFGRPHDAGAPAEDDLVAAVGRLGLMQLDSVNVLCRSHYLPLFSRLGRYDRSEPGADRGAVARELAAELAELATWLGLAGVVVNDRGDLAGELAAVVR